MIDEWQRAVGYLIDVISRDFLAEYTGSGSIKTSIKQVVATEDSLGSYPVKILVLTIGDLVCEVQPVARVMPVYTGMVRGIRIGTDKEFVMRRKQEVNGQNWMIAWTRDSDHHPDARQSWRYMPLSRDTFQGALDRIIS